MISNLLMFIILMMTGFPGIHCSFGELCSDKNSNHAPTISSNEKEVD